MWPLEGLSYSYPPDRVLKILSASKDKGYSICRRRRRDRAVWSIWGERAAWFFLLTVQYRILRSQSESAAC
eukprot:COSAG01_NODE_14207_length_1482_cov_14.899494_1_plen_70_part_10